mmetsp:Transcript_20494/g.56562  ORF Transcript_20494/g.56562 Transcript_20494/m.56562 type:complete len:242 (+) Transcript_20494:620-1345(+)|eukprot:CAMPEP_0168749714 /NCGR_PEP_ID=MMETSP0724-20121128/16864_1 /TAXON_ID=265536 /ORGANISM="Amphiprora sp., Strain CCMP467" /LENGTH=241 /DNA_ID=CAMNT_0008797643 /DNA_START=588 /DNA_END=1313 /DNA_ORIENTATION=+
MTDITTAGQEQPLATNSSKMATGTLNNGGSPAPPSVQTTGSDLQGDAKPPINKPTQPSSLMAQPIGTKPSLVEKAPMRFLIMDAPRQANLAYHIREMKRNNVTHVVRFCEPTYIAGELTTAGIGLHEMEYKDGTSPSKELIMSWLRLVESTFYTNSSSPPGGDKGPAIAVHCVAGLGRAPVMVAIALIEFTGMDPIEAVSFLRSKRRGAINEKQLLYLSGYKRMYKAAHSSTDTGCSCAIM